MVRRSSYRFAFLSAVLVSVSVNVTAHEALQNFVDHRIEVTVGPRYVDAAIHLTFYGPHALRERRCMDSNRNGTISQVEVSIYLGRLAPSLEAGIGLETGGRRLGAIPLYTPEIDLLDDAAVGGHPFVLRVFYFVPTPESIGLESVVELDDRLWPDTPARCTIRISNELSSIFPQIRRNPRSTRVFQICFMPFPVSPILPNRPKNDSMARLSP